MNRRLACHHCWARAFPGAWPYPRDRPGVLVVEQNAKLSLAIADRGYLIENGHIVGANDAASLVRIPPSGRLSGRQAGTRPRAGKAGRHGTTPGRRRDRIRPCLCHTRRAFQRRRGCGSLIGENLDGLGRANAAARPSSGTALSKAGGAGKVQRSSKSRQNRKLRCRHRRGLLFPALEVRAVTSVSQPCWPTSRRRPRTQGNRGTGV